MRVNEPPYKLPELEDLIARMTLTQPPSPSVEAVSRRRAPTAAAAGMSIGFLELSHDVLAIVTQELCDPLQPLLAVHLSSTAKGLRVPMAAQLAELKRQFFGVQALASLWGASLALRHAATGQRMSVASPAHRAVMALRSSCAGLRDATELVFEFPQWSKQRFALASWRTLGTLVRCGSLRGLRELSVKGSEDGGDEGVALVAAALRGGSLPFLALLTLDDAGIGPHGASALAAALTKLAVPSLMGLDLSNNQVGDEGLAALAPALRQLPQFRALRLYSNALTDEGLAAVFAPPTEGAVASLEDLDLLANDQITDAGRAALASALRSGALPMLKTLHLLGATFSAASFTSSF